MMALYYSDILSAHRACAVTRYLEFRNVRRWYDQIDAIEAWRDPFPAR